MVRVPGRLMSGAGEGGRQPGKSDSIDALGVVRAALREPELPVAQLARRHEVLDHLVIFGRRHLKTT